MYSCVCIIFNGSIIKINRINDNLVAYAVKHRLYIFSARVCYFVDFLCLVFCLVVVAASVSMFCWGLCVKIEIKISHYNKYST